MKTEKRSADAPAPPVPLRIEIRLGQGTVAATELGITDEHRPAFLLGWAACAQVVARHQLETKKYRAARARK